MTSFEWEGEKEGKKEKEAKRKKTEQNKVRKKIIKNPELLLPPGQPLYHRGLT